MTKKEYQRHWRLENKEKMRPYYREYSIKWRKLNRDKLRFYWVYNAMKRRCDEPQYSQYKDYGGRGITYCDNWKDFKNFKKDMFGGYKAGLTLDRIDVNGNYCKENCRWITHKIQNRNKRKHIFIEYKGKKITLAEYADLIGIKFGTLRSRYYRGMDNLQIIKPSLYRPAKL